jgi:phospholipase C
MPRHPSRRDALRALGATAVAPALTRCAPADPPTLEDWELIRSKIDTVVVVMMENRSFDHYMGALSLEEGRPDVDGLTAGLSNPDLNGEPVEIGPATVDCLEDPPHSWDASHAQFNGGANDGFVTEYAEDAPADIVHEVMAYWDRQMLPTYYAFADQYTICDQWFCSVMSSTWPNRFYALAAQNGGMTGNDRPPESFPSIFTRLDEADLSWGVYFGNLPFALLLPDVGTSPNFDMIEHFFEAAAEGTLPHVSWVEPVYGRNDDHPPEHPLAGQIFIQSVYEALASSPQWDRTLMIVIYDEHGGFHDHVPPPTAEDDRADEGFDQLGFRVPAFAVGPWVKTGHVSKVTYDHTSWLAFVENLLGLEPLTARDAAADPMVDVLDLARMRAGVPRIGVPLPPIDADDAVLYREDCNPLEQLFSRSYSGPRTHQPELDAFADAQLKGTPYDRRDQGDEVYGWLLDLAERRGVLRRHR